MVEVRLPVETEPAFIGVTEPMVGEMDVVVQPVVVHASVDAVFMFMDVGLAVKESMAQPAWGLEEGSEFSLPEVSD